MQVRVYQDGELAASFRYGRPPAFHGIAGEEVRALVETPYHFRNRWTGEVSARPRDDTPEWWASTILGAWLGAYGFTVETIGLPLRQPVASLAAD
jgi:hypothetical protein